MSNRSKGAKHELEACKYIEKKGYLTYKPQKTSRFGTQDIFNMFDIVAIKPEVVAFVQVKTGSTAGFLKKLKLFVQNYGGSEDVLFALMVRLDKRKTKKTWLVYDVYKYNNEVKVIKNEV